MFDLSSVVVCLTVILGIGYSLILAAVIVSAPQDPPSPNVVSDKLPTVAVVLSVYDEERTILSALRVLTNLDYPRERLSILIVDDCSTDGTFSMIKDFLGANPKLQTRIVRNEVRKGKARSVHDALLLINSELIAFTDADIEFESDAIKRMAALFTDCRTGAVSASARPCSLERGLGATVENVFREFYNVLRYAESEIDSPLMCEGGLSLFRRDALRDLPLISVCDDLVRTLTVRRNNFKAVYLRDPTYVELTSGRLNTDIRQKMRRGVNQQRTLLHFLGLVRPKYGRFGLIILPWSVFMMIVSPVLTAASVILCLALAVQGLWSTLLMLSAGIIPLSMLAYSVVRHYGRKDCLPWKAMPILGFGFTLFQLALFVTLFTKPQPIFQGPRS